MATIAPAHTASTISDNRFFMGVALAMALVIIAGFSMQFVMGRSTLAAPPWSIFTALHSWGGFCSS